MSHTIKNYGAHCNLPFIAFATGFGRNDLGKKLNIRIRILSVVAT